MKYLSVFFLFLASLSHAEAFLPWKDVVDAFVWIKIVPGSPLVMNEEMENQVSFRIFDDVYTITRERADFKIHRLHYQSGAKPSEESILMDSITMEKILKFAKAQQRAGGVLSNETLKNSVQAKIPPSGFQQSKTIYQCSSDLPSRIRVGGSVVNQILSHTWIQNGPDESFGMPNTDEAGYFGGSAHLRTPDSFLLKGPKHLKCAPVFLSSSQDEAKESQKLECIARSLSLAQNPVFDEEVKLQEWTAHFDYHALKRNCLMAVRFTLECAGATASQVVNKGIGGKFHWNDGYSISRLTPELSSSILDLRTQLTQLRNQESMLSLPEQSLKMMDLALELDARLRGVSGNSEFKSLRDICDLALQQCPN